MKSTIRFVVMLALPWGLLAVVGCASAPAAPSPCLAATEPSPAGLRLATFDADIADPAALVIP